MHAFALIPLLTLMVSVSFAAVSIAWDSKRRATRSMGAIFGCTALWAGVDLMTYLQSTPEGALFWFRAIHFGPLLLGPSVLWVYGQILPTSRLRFDRLVRAGLLLALVAIPATAFLPGSVDGVVALPEGGWLPRYGILSLALIPLGTILPTIAAVEARRVRQRMQLDPVDATRAFAIYGGVGFCVITVATSEYVLPVFGIPVPRLGALSVSICTAILWLRVLYVSQDLVATPQGIARSLLAELGDGVLLVGLDDRILSANARFAELAGLRSASLLGEEISRWLPAAAVAAEGERFEGEILVDGRSDQRIPVSITRSMMCNAAGQEVGRVVVVRDQREVDRLRRRLVTSGRLAAVGELAAGIAHEVNNPVAFVRSDLNQLDRRMDEIEAALADSETPREDLVILGRCRARVQAALAGLAEVSQVVGDVKEFAHAGGPGEGGGDVEALVEGAMRLARLHRGDAVSLRIASVVGTAQVRHGQELRQVLLGLFRWMTDRVEKGGSVAADLRTREGELVIVMNGRPLRADEGGEEAARFDLGESGEARSDHGFEMATEHLERLGGRLAARIAENRSLSVELILPTAWDGGET